MTGKLIASEPTPGQMITELYCWIGTYHDGTEGIIGGSLPGMGVTAMMSSRRHAAESLWQFAQRAQSLSLDTAHPVVSIRLATFKLVAP
jgi:hypothetical protein